MIPDDLEALALADAIGALDADERVELDARVALLTPDEQAHVASLYDVALALGASLEQVEPPARVRAAVIAATPSASVAARSVAELSPVRGSVVVRVVMHSSFREDPAGRGW